MKGIFPSVSLVTVFVLGSAGAAYSQTPVVAAGGILNAASNDKTGYVAPGSLVSIYGTELAASLQQSGSIPLSNQLTGVSVTINNVTAPLQFVSTGQINAQVPWEMLPLLPPVSAGTIQVPVVVTRNGVASAPINVTVGPASPGIFTFQFGVGPAIAVNGDGSIAAPANAGLPYTSHPAKAGDVLVMYATGLGAVDTTVADGDVPKVITSKALSQPTVLVGGQSAPVLFAGLVGRDTSGAAIGFVGVYQINFTVPSGAGTGVVPLQIQMNGVTSRNDVTIAVQ
jgi:uncharacterized protein (TIGR03437 family)